MKTYNITIPVAGWTTQLPHGFIVVPQKINPDGSVFAKLTVNPNNPVVLVTFENSVTRYQVGSLEKPQHRNISYTIPQVPG